MGSIYTPHYGIRTPDQDTQLYKLSEALQNMANDVEAAMLAAGIIPNTPTWTPYTPTITGLVVGGAGSSVVAGYTRAGKIVHFRVSIVLGTGRVVPSGQIDVTLPVPPNMTGMVAGLSSLGDVTLGSDSTPGERFQGQGVIAGGQVLSIRGNELTNGSQRWLSPTFPLTWQPGHRIAVTGTYAAA